MIHEITPSVFAVGVVDSEVRIFHGYEVPFGATYNAYLVLDGDNTILLDTAKAKFAHEFLSNIKEVIGERPLTHLIANHVEPDHSGAFPDVLTAYPNIKVFGTRAAERELKAYYPHTEFDFTPVALGDTLNTGSYTFTFVPMTMVHWPDSMCTYVPELKTLFSNDALGQHIGTGEFTEDELGFERLMERAGDYYANIVLPYGAQVNKLLDTIADFAIERVCPSHGVILTKHIPDVVAAYRKWAIQETDEKRGVVIYDTMWGTTEKLARHIAQEWEAQGISTELISLSQKHYSYAQTRMLEARYVAVGSATLNNQMLPTVAAFLTYAKGLRPKNRIGLAFGSYGWSGESVKYIQAEFEAMGWETLEPRKVQWNTAE